MGTRAPGQVTGLLQDWRRGDQAALSRLVPLLYAELRRLAHRHIRAQPLELSLQTTALVNEAYLRLADASQLSCHDRVHFLAVCAQLMRRILVDSARSRGSLNFWDSHTGFRYSFVRCASAAPAVAKRGRRGQVTANRRRSSTHG